MLQFTHALERGEHIVHLTHIVRLAQRILEAEIVSLTLIITTVLQEEQLQARTNRVAQA